jgi:dTDP-4-dehydrorhamnose reductase
VLAHGPIVSSVRAVPLGHNQGVRWLITGASGFLGANAVRALQPRDEVVGMVRDASSAPWCERTVTSDLLDAESLTRAVNEVRPDVVLHCAALADHRVCEQDPDLAHRLNADASGALAGAAASVGSRFIYVSTDAVFDGDRGWYAEDEQVSPTSAYGRSKAAGEQAVVAAHPSAVIARTNFFGWSPSSDRSILEFFTRELSSGRRVPGYVNYVVTSLFVEDVIDSIERIVEADEHGVFHVVSRDGVAKADFGRLVAGEFDLDAGLVDDVRADGPDRDLSLRSDRLVHLTGTPMPSQAEGIARARERGGF